MSSSTAATAATNNNRTVSFATAKDANQDDATSEDASAMPPPSAKPAPPTTSSFLVCPNCGSQDIEQQARDGAQVCTDCGVVVEENAIVSAVEFVEGGAAGGGGGGGGGGGAGGGSSSMSMMVGQFVSATSSKAYTGVKGAGPGHHGGNAGLLRGGASRYGFSRDSRETTLANGRRRIQEVASRLRLGSLFVDAAHRLFTIAVEKNFVQGRRTTHVVAACLYIACRQEKSQHMLIDFSDALQVNVYTLGTCFLKFRRLLGLKLEIIDPALYIYRFAAHLDLDDKANAVALTALRLVGRMKRDWIVAGRRPAGICAAALLIAARAHGFHDKHHHDVTRILRVCGLTVTQRIREFEQTPSAQLTLDQFNIVDLETEADPPVFAKNKIREARAKALQDGNVALVESGALDDPWFVKNGRTKRAQRWRSNAEGTSKDDVDVNSDTASTSAMEDGGLKPAAVTGNKMNEKKLKFRQLYQSIEEDLKKVASSTEDSPNESFVDPLTAEESQLVVHASAGKFTEDDEDVGAGLKDEQDEGPHPTANTGADVLSRVPEAWKGVYPKSKYGKALVLPDQASAEERQASSAPCEAKINLSEWKESMPDDSIDREVESLFRTDEEMRQKEIIFNKLNKDYIEQQERKESERRSAEAASKNQEKEDAAQAEGHARYHKTSRSRKRRRGDQQDDNDAADGASKNGEGGNEEPTTEEQLMAAVSSRKISRKINYDALSSIFDEDGSFSTDVAEDAGASEDPMFEMI